MPDKVAITTSGFLREQVARSMIFARGINHDRSISQLTSYEYVGGIITRYCRSKIGHRHSKEQVNGRGQPEPTMISHWWKSLNTVAWLHASLLLDYYSQDWHSRLFLEQPSKTIWRLFSGAIGALLHRQIRWRIVFRRTKKKCRFNGAERSVLN